MLPSPNLSLYRPDHGDWPDTWEIPVNANWDIIDSLFSGIRSDSGGTGHIHDGTDGQGPKVDHADLLNIGMTSHADLDTDLGKVKISAADTVLDFLQSKLVQGTNVTLTLQNPGGDENILIDVASVTPSLGDPADPSGEYGWKSFTSTTAPVVYMDNFNWPLHMTLDNADYMTDDSGPFLPFSTGYSAMFIANPPGGSPTVGRYASVVKCQTPHSEPQRATISITDINYSEMIAGDFISFTLAVFASPSLGPNLTHKYGVLLELHLVKLTDGPDTWQFTYRVVVIPDDVTQDQIHDVTLSDPEDITGCWELSIDRNGHVYVYYRRRMVFSTQTSPPSDTGLLLPYYPTLSASLVANGDPPYGGIGFGCQYDISPDSSVSLEARWFSMAGLDDLYYETAETPPFPPPADPLVIEYDDPEFWDPPGPNPPPAPNQPCCPPDKTPGDTISGVGVQPIEYVTACCTYTCPGCGAQSPGYFTNLQAGCQPCVIHIPGVPPDDPWDGSQNPPGDVTEGDTDGKTVENLPGTPQKPVMDSPHADVTINWWSRLDDSTLFFQYTVAPGSAGNGPVDVRYWSAHDPANKVTLRISDDILPAPVEITGLSFEDIYYGAISASPFTFYTYNVKVTGSGFTAGTIFTATIGTVNSTTLVDWNTVILEIAYGLGAGGTETITATKVPFVDSAQATVLPIPLEFEAGTISAVTGAGINGSVTVPFLTIAPTIADFPPGTLANITNIVHVPATNIVTFDFDVVAGPGTQVAIDVTDPTTTETIRIPLLTAQTGGAIPTITSVLTNITPYEGRQITVTINGTFDFDHYPGFTTLLDGPNGKPGGFKTITVAPTQMQVQLKVDTGGLPGPVDVIVSCPEAPITPARATTFVAGFTTQAVPSLTYVSASWGAGLNPGASGVMTFTGTGITDQAGEITISSDDPLVTFGAVSYISPTQFSVPYDIGADADGETVNFEVVQTLDSQTVTWPETLEIQPPVVDSVTPIDGGYIAPLRTFVVRIDGSHFDPAAIVSGTGWSVTGFAWVSATEMTADITGPGAAGPYTLRVTNPTGDYSEVAGAVPGQPAADVFHAEAGTLQSGVQVEFYLYGEFFDPPGLIVPEADSVDVSLRTYLQGKITPAGPPGTPITVTIDSTIGPTYGPFEIGVITASPPVPTVTGVSDPFPKEYKNYPLLEIYGTNLSVVDSVVIVPDVGEELKLPIRFWPLPVGLGTDPAPNSIVSKTDPMIKIDVTFAELLSWRNFHISLRDIGDAEIGTSANGTFFIESFDINTPLIDEAVVDPQIVPGVGLNYVMTVPLINTGILNLPGDNWIATNAVINSQIWSSPNWILDITNAGGPPGDPVELLLDRPDAPYLGDPPYAATYVYPLV